MKSTKRQFKTNATKNSLKTTTPELILNRLHKTDTFQFKTEKLLIEMLDVK